MSPAARALPRLRRDGLAPRIMGLLSVALLPLGLVALAQTRSFQSEAQERAGLSLLAVTAQAGSGLEREVVRALGAAEALSAAEDLLGDPGSCAATLDRFVEARAFYHHATFVPADGGAPCASSGAGASVPHPAPEGERGVHVRPVDGRGLLVSVPVAAAGGAARGTLTLTVPAEAVATPPLAAASPPLALVTFNDAGEVLTTGGAGPAEEARALLPEGRALAAEARGEPRLFEAADAAGERRVYTVAPLVPGVAYGLGVWAPAQAGRASGVLGWPFLFPLLMWLASLLVAFWAIHRLVVSRVAALGATMRRFGQDRRLPEGPPPADAAWELREIERAFRDMAQAILQDEARMEDAYRERGVLLREIHHRVKNNLQLISSIISMQVRRLPEPEARAALKRLQDRVLTLAAIYRTLYTSADMAAVDVAPVLRAVASQELQSRADAFRTELRIDDLVLEPDQAVPLAFLAAEAISNAAAHARAEGRQPRVEVALTRQGDSARLEVANSAEGPPRARPGQGLGRHLIQAFGAQLGAPVEAREEDGTYRLSVAFPVARRPAEAA